jgi:hypothetical protein
MSHTHIHTHVNTHFCECGSTHVSAHAHALVIDNGNVTSLPSTSEMILPMKKEVPVAQRTRSKMQRITWENTPWHVDDRDLVDLLAFLLLSDDPWERSLIPSVEKDAIERAAKRSKKAAF